MGEKSNTACCYETEFRLKGVSKKEVKDIEKWLKNENKQLTGCMQEDIRDCDRNGIISDFGDAVQKLSYTLDSKKSGHISLETNRPLNSDELAWVSEWASMSTYSTDGEFLDGLDDSPESGRRIDRLFARHLLYYCSEKLGLDLPRIQEFEFQQVSGPKMDNSAETTSNSSQERGPLDLSESDLDFAKQMSLSEFGLY